MPVQNVKRSNSSSAKPDGLTDARRCRFDFVMKVCCPGPFSDGCLGLLDGEDGAAAVDVLCSTPCNVPSVSEVDIFEVSQQKKCVNENRAWLQMLIKL